METKDRPELVIRSAVRRSPATPPGRCRPDPGGGRAGGNGSPGRRKRPTAQTGEGRVAYERASGPTATLTRRTPITECAIAEAMSRSRAEPAPVISTTPWETAMCQ